MPRKKSVDPSAELPIDSTPDLELNPPTPKPRRARKPKAEAPALDLAPAPEEPTKARRGRGKKAPSPVAEVAAAPVEDAPHEPASEPRRSRRRGSSRTKDAAPAPDSAPTEIEQPDLSALMAEFGDDLPMPVFRTVEPKEAPKRPAQRARRTPEPVAEEQPIEAPRGRRGRGRRGRGDAAPEPAETPRAVAAPAPAPLPIVELKPIIPTPADAPQVVMRNGIPTLVRSHRVYPPLLFCASPSERNAPTVFEELRMAAAAGVHLHEFLVELEVGGEGAEYAFQMAGFLLRKAIEVDPEAQVIFRLGFAPPRNWEQRYPRARFTRRDGTVAEPSVCDDAFWGDARTSLTRFVEHLLAFDTEQHVMGIHLDRGEWFYPVDHGYDRSDAAREGFRDWARTRYRNDEVALRAAWFDGRVRFDNLSIPDYQGVRETSEQFVRSRRSERRWVDYHLFLSDATVVRIADLAYAAKEASGGRYLVGVSYGYTFEWTHPDSAHLSLGKLLRTPEIDFIAGPPSYQSREAGGACPFPGPIDSYALNGKLYLSEEDFKTPIGDKREPDEFNPVIKTPQALANIHWRGVGSALAHGAGICWMDLWGNGWLKTPSIWERAKSVRESLVQRMTAPPSEPDVAVFIDERALAYLVDQRAFERLVLNVRESVLRSGLSCAFYLLSDLQYREHFPESKLYVFVNAWDVRPELRAAIKNRLQKNGKVLFWLYAAGLFDSGRESLERVREITGIAIKPQPFHSRAGTTLLNRRHPLSQAFSNQDSIGGSHLEPSYFAIPEEAIVLGEYSQNGLPSFVVREFRHEHDQSLNWNSVFLGEPVVTPSLVRALGQYAGAHVWNFQDDVVHVRPPFLTVHCTGTGPRTIALPSKWSAYDLLSGEWLASEGTSLRFEGLDGATHVFLVGIREELEALLSTDPEALLRMEELPPKEEDTTRFDLATFDVPIMKLDEWMDFGDADDISDELLFKPRLIEESLEPESEAPPRRRRRRRDREGTEEVSSRRLDGEAVQASGFEDLDISAVFRKRD